MSRKQITYSVIPVLACIVLPAVYLLISDGRRYQDANHAHPRTIALLLTKSGINDRRPSQPYIQWRDSLFDNGKSKSDFNLSDLISDKIVHPKKISSHDRQPQPEHDNGGKKEKTSEPAEAKPNNADIKHSAKKATPDLKGNKSGIETNESRSVVAAASPDRTNKGTGLMKDSSSVDRQKKNVTHSSGSYTAIPFGFNQIQNRLSSLVRKKNTINQAYSANPITAGSMQQLVLNKTRTNIGGAFFDAFNEQWRSLSLKADYTITVTEKLLPNVGSMIMVNVNNSLVYQTQLNPNSKYINWVAAQAVSYVRRKLQNEQGVHY